MARAFGRLPPLAFVDVETTGFDPVANRIAEIGVITVDGDQVSEWTTFIAQADGKARTPRLGSDESAPPDSVAPSFADVAVELHSRLANRLFVAHNARFDYTFLKSEFERARMAFECDVFCTLALSRRLFPGEPGHDLDSLVDRHHLAAPTRHRALADARIIHQFWNTVRVARPAQSFLETLNSLLAEPAFPDGLDIGAIARMPDSPGVYLLFDDGGNVLHVGAAQNLRLRLFEYFRLDRISAKALAVAQKVGRIEWHATGGMLEARLLRVSLASAHKPHVATRCFTWSLDPARHPALALAPLPDARFDEDGHYFGMYVSERKAQNEVLRLAREHRLCHSVLGIRDDPSTPCLACASNPDQCAGKARRLQQLTRSYCALEPLRVKQWPNDGPIGIRERAAIHLFDDWRYIGTVRDDGGIADALALPRAPFNHAVYRRLVSLLPALPARRLVRFCGKKERGGTTEPG